MPKATTLRLLSSRADGTALPVLPAAQYRKIAQTAEGRVAEAFPRFRAILNKLLEGQETLKNAQIQELRKFAKHPLVEDTERRALQRAADVHAEERNKSVPRKKFGEDEGILSSRADGTPLPILRAAQYQSIAETAQHRVAEHFPKFRAILNQLLEGQKILGTEQIKALRRFAQHPLLDDKARYALELAADMHEAAWRKPPASPQKIKRDVDDFLKTVRRF